MYHGTLTWTKLILKFCYFPVNVPDTLSGKLRYLSQVQKVNSKCGRVNRWETEGGLLRQMADPKTKKREKRTGPRTKLLVAPSQRRKG